MTDQLIQFEENTMHNFQQDYFNSQVLQSMGDGCYIKKPIETEHIGSVNVPYSDDLFDQSLCDMDLISTDEVA